LDLGQACGRIPAKLTGAEVLMPEYVSQAHHLSWQVEDSLLLVLGSAEAVKPEGMRWPAV